MRNNAWLGASAAIVALGVSATAEAFPTEPSVEVTQRGGFLLVGNSQGYDCSQLDTPVEGSEAGEVPSIPGVDGTGACDLVYEGEEGEGGRSEAAGATDTALDLFWTHEDGATLAQQLDPTAAVSGAVLTIPDGARITHARLYWAGYLPQDEDAAKLAADPSVKVTVPSGDEKTIEADAVWTEPNEEYYWYQSAADVTPAVQAHGSGLYLVTDLATAADAPEQNDDVIAAWWLAVLYEDPDSSVVNLRLYDGLDVVGENEATNNATPAVRVSLSGLPARAATGGETLLGVVGYEGDARVGGDYVQVNQTPLANAFNPAANFFNGTRSTFGKSGTNQEDFPFLTGGPRSVAGLDIDVVDVSEQLAAGSDLPIIEAGSFYDRYLLAGLVTQVPASVPLIEATKSVEPVAGEYEPGGVVEYTIVVENTGSAPAAGVTLTDVLPEQLAFVEDSVQSDASIGAGQIGFDDASQTLTVRLGDSAGPNGGGMLAAGESLEVRFSATIIESLPGCASNPCVVSNQGVIEISGSAGDATTEYLTDGEPSSPSLDPTVFEVKVACLTDDDCPKAAPVCDANTCVECTEDDHCPNAAPVCDANTCVECTEDAQCSDDAPFCVESTCVECKEDKNCTAAAPDCNAETHVCECTDEEACGDSDDDGLSDGEEIAIGTDPEDADTDDDGLLDGDEPDPGGDSDGDGLIDARDVDSDNDGLLDGTEAGTDCSHKDTDPDADACIPDADGGDTTTDPAKADTDDGGLQDGAEDLDFDGEIDKGETDPNDPDDDSDLKDSDGDGLSDEVEIIWRSDPHDADTDDDGVLDGDEPNPGRDDDGDGRTSVTDADSDNDGLFDGTELGLGCDHEDTDPKAHSCVADADEGETTTSPIDPDTDDGGISDGSEDFNLDGAIDDGEGDPNDPSDDSSIEDSDDDGLSDGLEDTLGSDPNDADTDDDGVLDGDEANPSQDLDGDGANSVLDPDSDGDLLLDGVEVGTDCSNPDSDPAVCVADADAGLTTTSPIDADTNADGVVDGAADVNLDGVIDETDELYVDAEIKGGGCGCSTPRSGGSGSGGLLLALGALGLAAARRRRRR